MNESGTKAGGAYMQSITGTDEYTLFDEGNLGDGHYTRTINGTGAYERISEGPGATQPTDAGGYTYLWQQTGDPHSGTFDLTQTGTARYDLLEDFFDISNTGNGQTPGHMNFYPFGQTFVDPSPEDLLGGRNRFRQMMGRTFTDLYPNPPVPPEGPGPWSLWRFHGNYRDQSWRPGDLIPTHNAHWVRERQVVTYYTRSFLWIHTGSGYEITTERETHRSVCPYDPAFPDNMLPSCLPPGGWPAVHGGRPRRAAP